VNQKTNQPQHPPRYISPQELLRQFQTSLDGLATEDVPLRLAKYGFNELEEKRVDPLLKFLSYFWGPIPWMIEVAAALSAVVRHWADLVIILVLLIVNAVVGFWEEHKADTTIAELKATLALKAKVKRGGAWTSVPARELVPGDIIRVRLGDIVPADVRLLTSDPVEVDQSALTGESLPVPRQEGEVLYSGSIIRLGEADALVTGTGKSTFIGTTAHLIESVRTVSHFQRAVFKIADYLILVAITLVILIVGVALFRGDNMVMTLQFALVLTVASIPVAMPTVLSVTMAVGAKNLARNQAVVNRLATIEEMAGIDVLCADKTGTLTENKLTVGEPYCMNGVNPDDLLFQAALASRAEDQDIIDLTVLGALKDKSRLATYKLIHFQPFDPVQKRTEATVQDAQGHTFRVSKGAPQVILPLASLAAEQESELDRAVQSFAERGFRSLGVAKTDEKDRWQVLGIIPLYDPPRKDSKEMIERTRQMGVKVKMLTGDQTAIAKEVARRLDLGPNILDASLFSATSHHETGQLEETIEQADGFAQVFPEHKYHIVEVLQEKGHFVGMTGDGVNDAPALKKADSGIAVLGAADAARSAADIVLLAPGLSVITKAIEESRTIFGRMNNYAIYRIAETMRVLLFMTLSILVFNFYPVTAVMIVLLALLNDGAIISIAYDRVRGSRTPEKWDMRTVLGLASVLGVMGVVASFGLFYLAERKFHLSRETIQSLMYLKLSVAGHLTIFITRTRGPFWSFRPAPILLAAVLGTQIIATILASLGIFMVPIGWTWASFVWGYALVWFIINDRVKLAALRILSRHEGLFQRR
jgi:H+-transporting ATPase